MTLLLHASLTGNDHLFSRLHTPKNMMMNYSHWKAGKNIYYASLI